MVRFLIPLGFLALLSGPTLAQQGSLQQQVDAAAAEAHAVVTNLRGTIMQQAAHIVQIEAQNDALNKQVAALTKERDELKTKPDAAQPK